MAIDRDKTLQEAQRLVERKRYDKAVVLLQQLVAADPKDVRVLLMLGDAYVHLEQYVDAVTTYERVGQLYTLQGFALKAITVYKRVRDIIQRHVPSLEERFSHILPRLGELYTQLGLTSDARATYDEVATKLQRAGREREAVDVFKKVVDLDPNNPLSYLRLAEAYVRVRDVENAIRRFGAAAEILVRLGRPGDAIKVVERILQHRADAAWARMAAEIYLNRGLPNDAMAALAKLQIAFKDNPRDLETLSLLARAFDLLGQPQKAVEVLKEAARVAKEAGRQDVVAEIVQVLLERAPNDEAVRALAAALAPPPSVQAPVASPEPEGEPEAVEEVVEEIEDVELADDLIEDVDPEPEPEPEAPFALAGRTSAPALPAADPALRARQLAARAESLRQRHEFGAAAELLRRGVRELPDARELREKLCDLLIEAGDQPGAVAEMLAFAEHLAEVGDVEGAARVLDEILLLEPDHADAVLMLSSLGYVLPGAAPAAGPGYDPNAPLPSYDLEEIDPGSVMPAPPPAAEAPLPRFAMEDEATQYMELPAMSLRDMEVEALAPPASAPEAEAVDHGGAQLDEDALEEIEFFTQQGMLEEARGILLEQLARLPNHPLLLERQRELEAALGLPPSAGESGPRSVPRSQAPEAGMVDRSFDIAASLDALDSLEGASEDRPSDVRGANVEAVFQQFKAGIAAQISPDDAATHYDLGTAYKDMGLFPDAIGEFELAARDPSRECVCRSMIGMIHLQLGNVDAAIDAFLRGLEAPQRTPDQEVALDYEIGSAYEQRKNFEQALYYFQRAARINPRHRDPRGSVEDRIRRLESSSQKPGARAVGDEEIDLDAVFDNLLGK